MKQLVSIFVLVALVLFGTNAAFAQSTANYSFGFANTGSLVDMSSGTTSMLAAATYHDDVASSVTNIGFTFTMMGVQYTQFSANSNGQLRLGSTVIGGGAQSSALGVPLIAPMGGDNAIQIAGKLHYRVDGTVGDRILVVEWQSLRLPFSSTPATGSVVQALLYENGGKIEFRYGQVYNNSGSSLTRTIFFSSSNTANTVGYVTVAATPTYTSAASAVANTFAAGPSDVADLSSASDGSRWVYTFTPPVGAPADPINLTFTSVGRSVMTVNWEDNSTNEAFFTVSRATAPGGPFTLITTVPTTTSGTTGTAYNSVQTGLSPNTTYYFRIAAAHEGAASGNLASSQATETVTAFSGAYTIDASLPNTGTNYTTWAEAFSLLNLLGVSGPTTFTVSGSGNPVAFAEANLTLGGATTGPGGGLSLLLSTLSSTNTLIFVNDAGKTINMSGVGVSTSIDYVFRLAGVDYVTFDGINIVDVGTTNTTWMEFGYVIHNNSATDGANNNTIKNFGITLNKSNTSLTNGPYGVVVGNGTTIVTFGAAGTFASRNNNNKIQNFLIQNLKRGIQFDGLALPAYDEGNEVSGLAFTSAAGGTWSGGSRITNFGGATSGTDYAIGIDGQKNLKVFNVQIDGGLETTAGTAMSGIHFGTAASTSDGCDNVEIYNCVIRDLQNNLSTTSGVIGIRATATTMHTMKIYNTAIYDIRATAATGASVMNAMNLSGPGAASKIELYNNSINITGATAAAGIAKGLVFGSASLVVVARNNAIQVTGGGSTGGAILADFGATAPTLLTFSNNMYNVGTTSAARRVAVYNSINRSTLLDWQSTLATPSDGHDLAAGYGDIGFASGTDLTYGAANRVNNSGTPVTGLSTGAGILGTTRSGTAPDIGIFEGDFSAGFVDAAGPRVEIAPFMGSIAADIPVRITDNLETGSNLTATLWYRGTPFTGAFTALAPDATPSGATNGIYRWNTSLQALATGTYQYYVGARDAAGNSFIVPTQAPGSAGVYTTVGNAGWTVNPLTGVGTRTFQSNGAALAGGTYNVGATETYPTLTAVANAVSQKPIAGNVIFELTNNYDGTGETFPIVFNQPSYDGSGGPYTITIRPAASVTVERVVQGDPGTGFAVIYLDGARYVTIDGRPGGTGSSRLLRVTNSRNAATIGEAIALINDALSNTIKYITAESNNPGAGLGVIGIGGTFAGGQGNNFNTIDNCDIRNYAAGTATPPNPARGLVSFGSGTNALNNGNTFSNNLIHDFHALSGNPIGIRLASTVNHTITGNHFYQTTVKTGATGLSQIISVGASTGAGHTITGNFIGGSAPNAAGTAYDLTSTSGIYAIDFDGTNFTTQSTIASNTIANFDLKTGPASGAVQFTGLYLRGGNQVPVVSNGNTIGSTSVDASVAPSVVVNTTTAFSNTAMGIFAVAGLNTITNNTIGGFKMMISGAGTATSFTGIQQQTAGFAASISGNTIGSSTTAKSIYQSTNAAMNGIVSSVGGSITNNTVANFFADPVGGGSSLSSLGITVSSGIATITDNTIRNFTSNGTNTGTSGTAAFTGINVSSSTVNHVIARNLMHSVSVSPATPATAAVVQGMYLTSGTGTVSRNRMYSLVNTATSATARLYGTMTFGGSWTFNNNMVSVGTGSDNDIDVRGMREDAGGTCAYNYNTVRVGGTAPNGGTVKTYAFLRSFSTALTLRNNIFINARTSTGDTSHVGIGNSSTGAGWTATSSDYNLVNGSIFGHWQGTSTAANGQTLSGWKTISGGDANTLQGTPTFVNAPTDLHLSPGNALGSNNATPLASVTDDYDGDARSLTTPDRGADEYTAQAPGAFSLLSPADAATDVLLSGNLTWSSSQYVTTYDLYFDTNPNPTTLVSADQAGTTYAYAGLSNSTTYYWKVVAKNANGNTASSIFSFSTVAVLPPAAPTDLVLGPVTFDEVATAWTDNSSDEDGFRVYRATAPGGPFTNISGDLAVNTTAYVSTGLVPNTKYYYRVVAFNVGAGESTPVSKDTTTLAQTPGAPTLSEAAVTTMKVTLVPGSNPAATQFAARVSFTGPEVVKYLHTNGTLQDTVVWGTYAGFGGASGKVMTGLTGNTSYTVDVQARNANLIETAFGSSSSLSTLSQLAGTYAVGSAQSSPFNTLTGAVGRLNAVGVSAAVTFELEDALYSGGETFPITINQFAGASAVNTVKIKPSAGNNAAIQGSSTTSIIRLNGADYVTIDGSNNGSTSRNLTIQNNSAATNTAVIWVSSLGASAGATDNTIKNSVIRAGANGAAANTFGVYIAGTSISTTGTGAHNHNNTVQNNLIQKAYYGVYASGAASNLSNNLQVKQNTIGADIAADYVTFRGVVAQQVDAATISNNRIYNMITGESVAQRAIQCEAVFTNSTIDGNIIHDILNTTTTGFRGGQGISVSTTAATASNSTVSNNVIYNLNGHGSTTNTNNSWGIITFTGNNYKIYHNSISLTGAGTTTGSTDNGGGLLVNASASTGLDVRDNAFYITQTPGNTSTGGRFGVYSAAVAAAFTNINYNDYYVSGARAFVGFLGSNRTTLGDWQTATTQDAQSISSDPLFNGPTSNLRPQVGSPLVSAGFNVGTAQDALGVTRGDPPTIGAYEQAGDFSGPSIVYTPLGSTSFTGARTLNATISDASGVPTAGVGLPRLYWRINAGAYSSAAAAHLGGSSYQFSFGSGVNSGDVVSYYVVAQDLNDNVSVFPVAGATGLSANPPAVSTAPTTPNSYTITNPPLSGDFTVGVSAFAEAAGINLTFEKTTRKVMREVPVAQEATRTASKEEGKEPALTASEFAVPTVLMEVEEEVMVPMVDGKLYDGPLYLKRADNPDINLKESLAGIYATLTAAVADVNLRGVSGPTRLLLIDSAYSVAETFPITVQISSDSLPTATNTLTIKPDAGKTPIITGAVSGDRILRVYNTPYVIIDGSNTIGGTTRDMTLVNSHVSSSGVVRFGSVGTTPLNGVVLKNCIVINGQTGSSSIVANDATAGTAGYFSNMTIQNNDIRTAFNAIFVQAVSAPQGGANLNILNNKLDNTGTANIRLRGIYVQGVNGATIRGNSIGNFNGVDGENDQGIWLASGTTNAVVEQNSIHSMNYTGTGGWGAHGVVVSSAATDANIIIRNNMIYNLSGDGWTFTGTSYTDNVMGIHLFSTQSGVKVYNNSIHLYGNTLNTTNSLSMGITLATGTTADVKNNVVVNNLGLLGATGYGATGYFVQSASISTSDYNDVVVNPTGGGEKLIGQIGQTPASGNHATLNAWQTASGQDANSISADPLFVSNTNLHINNGVGILSPVANKGVLLGDVTNDFDGDTRTATPDMGADEFTLRAPVAFNVLTPSNGATLQPTSGNLTWENPAGSSFFDVFFDITPSPTSVLATNHAGTSIPYSGNGGTTYYWNVVAKNSDSSTTSSNGPFSFETELVQLSLTSSNVAFGNVVVGNTGNDSVWVKNTGTVSVTVDSVKASGGEFAVLPGGPFTIGVGDSVGLDLTFSPSAPGAQAGIVVVYSDAPSTPDTVTLSGTGLQPGFFVNPASLSFGAISVGSFAVDSVTVTNTGTLTVNVSANGPDPEFAVVPNGPIAISAGDSAKFYVTFSPSTPGVKNATIDFTHDAPGSPYNMAVSGEGLALTPVFSVTPTSLSFGTVVVGDFRLDSVEVSNPGLADLEITSATGPDAQFAVVPNAATINPGNSFTFFVTFAPATPGPKSGNIIFVHNAASSPDSVAVDGFGADSTNILLLTVTPDSIIAKSAGKLLKPVKRGKGLHPNWANLMDETVAQGGFGPGTSEGDQAGGMVVGVSHMFEAAPGKWKPVKDSAAVRGWVRLTKWNFAKNLGKGANALQKTLEDKTGKHTGSARGFDQFANLKPFVKQQNKLTPKKHNNKLFAELVALKLNIAMSQLGKTPAGFGDLIYDDDASVYDEMSITEISDEADLRMTYWQDLSSTQYRDLYDVVKAINAAFVGSLDTISFNAGGKLQVHGKVALGSVSFLKAPTPFVPTRISPTTNETESEEDLDFEDTAFDDSLTPVAAKLYQNYPNPFNPSTTIGFRLREASLVTIRVYNTLGQEVAALISNEEMEEGFNTVQFAAGQLASGVYFYQIHAQGLESDGLQTSAALKMVLLK